MAVEPIDFTYSDGTATLTNGSDIVQGIFTAWDPAVLPYDILFVNGGQNGTAIIREVLAVNQIRLTKAWAGPNLTDVPYEILRWIKHTDPRIYGVRVSDYLTRLKGIPEDLDAVAGEIAANVGAYNAAVATLQQVQTTVTTDAATAASGAATATARAGETSVDAATATAAANDAQYYASLVGAVVFDFAMDSDPSLEIYDWSE